MEPAVMVIASGIDKQVLVLVLEFVTAPGAFPALSEPDKEESGCVDTSTLPTALG